MPEANLRKLRAIEAFLMGAGSVWCILPMVSVPARLEMIYHASDSEALASDWSAVGSDLSCAITGGADTIHEPQG
jgi:hypothetical protein